MKNNTKLRDIVENAIFSQLSKINIKFKNSGDNSDNKPKYNKYSGNHLPKIYNIELTLLSQNDSISEFKKYGYGIYQLSIFLLFNNSFNHFGNYIGFRWFLYLQYFF